MLDARTQLPVDGSPLQSPLLCVAHHAQYTFRCICWEPVTMLKALSWSFLSHEAGRQ